jgi:hypothetical protein
MVSDGRMKLVLQPSLRDISGCDFEIVGVEHATKQDRYEGYGAKLIEDRVTVLSPYEDEPHEIAVVMRMTEYKRLAAYLKTPVNLAWARIRRGRTVTRVFHERASIFVLEPIGREQTYTSDDLEAMENALADADVGSVVTDPYELRLIKELCIRYGEKLG